MSLYKKQAIIKGFIPIDTAGTVDHNDTGGNKQGTYY